jgi:exodeoxyribonuclease VII small subunit
MTMPTKKDPQTFEAALERVEKITGQMENGELPLEELVLVYEEGLRLIQFCSSRLEEAEKRLQTITRNAAGEPQGFATIQDPGEIPSSTPPASSGTEEKPGGPGGSANPARFI